jgi:mRNA interferase MazF
MKSAGKVALLRLPQTDLLLGKNRPALILAEVPGQHDDWLVCMISTQLHQAVADFDEIITAGADDFTGSGLKVESVIRIGRLAVVSGGLLEGAIGNIGMDRLRRIKDRLSHWVGE